MHYFVSIFLSRVALKFDAWPWKTIGHIFYTASSFVHHSIAIGEFKLEFESGNAQFGSKSTLLVSRHGVTLKFDGWHWTRQIWGIWKLQLAYSPETPNLGQNRWCFVPFDGWPWKTIGHLSFAVSSSMHHFVAIDEFKLELQSGNAQFGSKSTIFRAVWPCNLTYDLEKNRAPLLCYLKLCASFRSHRWLQTWVTVRKHPIWVKFDDF